MVLTPADGQTLAYASSSATRATSVTLRRDGDRVVLVDDLTQGVVSSSPISSTRNVVVRGLDGDHNDTLTVDLRGGLSLPEGVEFDAGVAGFDTLNILHDPANTVRFDYEPDDAHGHRGRVVIDGMVIAYSGIEPLTNTGTAANIIFTLPTGTVGASLQDDGSTQNGLAQLASTNATFETTTFMVPTISLTVNSGGGTDTITVASSFGFDFSVSLTINGNTGTNTVNLNALDLSTGSLTVTGQTINVLGNVTTSGAQTYNNALTLGANATLTGGNITFVGTINGAHSLAVNTPGATTFSGAVGGSTALTSLTTDAVGSTTLNGGSVTTTGAQTYSDPVILGANNTLTSTVGGNITFAGTINGQHSLSVNTSGVTTFSGAVGGTSALASLLTDGLGTTALNGGSVTTTGVQNYNDAVTLGTNTTIVTTTNAGDVTFFAINGAFSLAGNAAGITRFGGPVGANTPLSSVTTAAVGSSFLQSSITTTGAQTYNDPVALSGTVTLTSTGRANVTFNSTVDNHGDLTVNTSGVTTFAGVVGSITALSSLTTDAGGTTAMNGGGVTTLGTQSYNDAVTLGASTTLALLADGAISLTAVNGAFGLTIDSASSTSLNGAIGSTTALSNVIAYGPLGIAIAANVTTTGSQSYNDLASVTGNRTLTSTAAGNITLAKFVNGSGNLTVNTGGTTTFGGVVSLATLTTDAAGTTAINGGNVTTTGMQQFLDSVSLNTNTRLSTTAGGSVNLNAVDGSFSLEIESTGGTFLAGSIGGTIPLASLTTSSTGTTNFSGGGSVSTSGPQDYLGGVALGVNTTLTSTGGNINLSNTVNGAFALTLNASGTTTFGAVVGGTTPLASLTRNASGSTKINAGSITTTGNQTYSGPVTLGTDTALNSAATILLTDVVSGPSALTKAGAGTMFLTATNTYSGGTNVNVGTLLVTNTGGSATGTGPVTVSAGATLGGTGDISGTVDVQDNGRLSPGSGGIGTLSMANATWDGSSTGAATAQFNLSPSDTTADQLALTGALTKGAGTTYKFDFQGSGHAAAYTLATFSSTTFSASDFTFTNLGPGLDGAFSIVGGNTLRFTAGPSGAAFFSVNAPANATAGSSFSVTVTALDQFNATATGYSGTVHFTSSDAQAILPANSTLTNGVGTFSATLKAAGNQTITATDTITSATGSSSPIAVSAATATHFLVTAPASAPAGSAFAFTVAAHDPYENTNTGYSGTVHFTSTDGAAVLPGDSILSGGAGTLSATLFTSGTQTITTTDVATLLTGTSAGIGVFSCSYSLSSPGSSAPAEGMSGGYNVIASPGCPWSAFSDSDWLTTASTGIGNGPVDYTAAANAMTAGRPGSINVAGQIFTVTQAGVLPSNLTATATSTTSVSVTWSSSAVNHFELWRNSGSGFAFLSSPSTTTFTDDNVVANTAYVYKVRAVDTASNASSFSNLDLATTVLFTDDPLIPGVTLIKAVHPLQLMFAVNLVRAAAGLSTLSFTDPPVAGGSIRLSQVVDLRNALDPARTLLGLAPMHYTLLAIGDADGTAGFAELRDGVK